jgi:Zn finger protein HypA/HybF involved in hydrogenase expression
MFNMNKTAKELIAKGEALQDNELIEMGQQMLFKNVNKHYICTNCQHEFVSDKPNRKKCPQCKKNKLIYKPPIEQKKEMDEFHFQIRTEEKNRIRYDENGQPVGKYTKSTSIDHISNVWQDDLSECFDEENELLKSKTIRSPRKRKAVEKISIKCNICNKLYMMHPLHVKGRAVFVCDVCIRKRSRL